MDYNKIVQGILDIGEAMRQSGAENFRLEDSFYRMCRSYGFKRSDVFVIPSNIQVTVETPEGEIITQIRHIESSEPNFDQLDYLNNLCRYVCQHTPDEKEMREKYLEVINREPQKRITRYAAAVSYTHLDVYKRQFLNRIVATRLMQGHMMHTIMEEIARVMKIGLSCGVTIRKASICASLSTKANSRTKATGHMIFSSPKAIRNTSLRCV